MTQSTIVRDCPASPLPDECIPPPGPPTTATTVAPPTTTTTTSTILDRPALPVTGGDVLGLGILGSAAITVGVVITAISRRRPSR